MLAHTGVIGTHCDLLSSLADRCRAVCTHVLAGIASVQVEPATEKLIEVDLNATSQAGDGPCAWRGAEMV